MAQRGSETAPAITRSIAIIIHSLWPQWLAQSPAHSSSKGKPRPNVCRHDLCHMAADDGGTSIVYTLVMAILVGGAVQSAIAIWLWERLCPRRSTPTDAATIHMAVPTPTDAIHMAVPTPTATPTPTAPTQMLLTRTVSTQSQTTYKWWWQQPRFMPLPENSHGVGLIDPFRSPRRG